MIREVKNGGGGGSHLMFLGGGHFRIPLALSIVFSSKLGRDGSVCSSIFERLVIVVYSPKRPA